MRLEGEISLRKVGGVEGDAIGKVRREAMGENRGGDVRLRLVRGKGSDAEGVIREQQRSAYA